MEEMFAEYSRVALEMYQVPALFLEIVKAAPTTLSLPSSLSVEVASPAITPMERNGGNKTQSL